MNSFILEITLLSDTTFGRGDGVASVVDQEVEYDAATGLPIIKGRTLKGLLVEECANILYALKLGDSPVYTTMSEAANRLFGVPGSDLGGQAILHIGTGVLPHELAEHLRVEIAAKRLTSREVLEALTTIRYQTAADPERDTPKDNTLRAIRVILRETVFEAPVLLREQMNADEAGLLAACAASLRRAGHSRSRGRGRIAAQIIGLPDDTLDIFVQRLKGGV